MKQSIKRFLQNNAFTTFDIAIAGMIIAIWVISSRFITINLGFMRFGITYAFAILVGLIFKPLQGILISIISDTISLFFTAGIAFWVFEYAIIYPGIVIITTILKKFMFSSNKKIFLLSTISIQMITLLISITFSIIYSTFIRKSSSSDNFFDYTTITSKVLMWIVISVQVIFIFIMSYLYFYKNNNNLKNTIALTNITFVIIVIFIWIWGPIANIRFLIMHMGKNNDLWNSFDLYLIPRILKTPISASVYVMIVAPLWKSIEIVKKGQNKW